MSTSNTPEILGKAIVAGTIAVLIATSAPVAAAITSTVAVFCVGRWLAKKLN